MRDYVRPHPNHLARLDQQKGRGIANFLGSFNFMMKHFRCLFGPPPRRVQLQPPQCRYFLGPVTSGISIEKPPLPVCPTFFRTSLLYRQEKQSAKSLNGFPFNFFWAITFGVHPICTIFGPVTFGVLAKQVNPPTPTPV